MRSSPNSSPNALHRIECDNVCVCVRERERERVLQSRDGGGAVAERLRARSGDKREEGEELRRAQIGGMYFIYLDGSLWMTPG
jgi:hypothetical protein